MTGLQLQAGQGFSLPVCILNQPNGGLVPKQSPQQLVVSNSYQYGLTTSSPGSNGTTGMPSNQVNEALVTLTPIAASGNATLAITNASMANPVGENASLTFLNEVLIAFPVLNIDNTVPGYQITLVFNAAFAAAMGFSASVTKTMQPGDSMCISSPIGLVVGAGASVTITNNDTHNKVNIYTNFGGIGTP